MAASADKGVGKYDKLSAHDADMESSDDSESFYSDASGVERRLRLEELAASKSLGLAACPTPAAWYRRVCSMAVVSCAIYSVASISMVLSNKWILSGFHFKYDMVLLFFQNSTSLVMLLVARAMGWITFEDLNREKALSWLPLNFFFVLMLLTGFFSLEQLSVPMMTIFKNSANLLVTFGDFAFYGQSVSRGVIGCLALMIGAAVFAAINDISLNRVGIAWALCNCVVSAAYVLYMPRAMRRSQLSSYGKVYYNSALSLPLIICLDLVSFNDFARLARTPEAAESFANVPFISVLVFSGFVGCAISFASFNCVRHTSPTTFSMVGSMNKIPLSVLGVFLFNTHLTAKSTVFIALSLLAGILYAYTKAHEAERIRKRMDEGAAKPSGFVKQEPEPAKIESSAPSAGPPVDESDDLESSKASLLGPAGGAIAQPSSSVSGFIGAAGSRIVRMVRPMSTPKLSSDRL